MFKDLAVVYGFQPQEGSIYTVDVIGQKGKRGQKISSFKIQEPALSLDSSWLSGYEGLDILIRILRPGSSKPGPYVLVKIGPQGIKSVSHED